MFPSLKKNWQRIALFIAIIVVSAIVFTSQCIGPRYKDIVYEDTVKFQVDTPVVYGIRLDTVLYESAQFPNDFALSTYLEEKGISHKTVLEMSDKAKPIFDVRKIRGGNTIGLFYSADSLSSLRYFVYEVDKIQYLVFKLGDTVSVSMQKRTVHHVERVVTGEIKTSLWDAIEKSGAPVELALELSDVYAWTVDFFGLYEGDKFTVVYKESWADSIRLGIDSIVCARFQHRGDEIYAIPFMQNGQKHYFDQKGNSLRKAFLKAPLQFRRISSLFSKSRLHPVLKIRRPHYGVDYAAAIGTPVMSIGDGVVQSTGYHGGAGNMVKVKHNSSYISAYLHLSRFGAGVRAGSRVKQGQVIGYVGSTGLSSGPHLDFRITKNGTPIDPLKVESPSVEPVKSADMDRFKHVRDSLKKLMQKPNIFSKLKFWKRS